MKSREQELEEALAWAQKRIETQAAEIRRLHDRATRAELALKEAMERLVILDGADKRLEAMERAEEARSGYYDGHGRYHGGSGTDGAPAQTRSPRVPVEGPMADMRRDLDALASRVADLEVAAAETVRALAGDELFSGAADRVRRRARGAKEEIDHG